jgi:hypothetical protein
MKNLAILMSIVVLCSACASTDPARQAGGASAPSGVTGQVGQAVTAPLSDLNLVKAEIPPVLVEAQKAPYGVPADRSCSALAADIQALDAVLGADLDTPVTASNPSLIERGTGAVSHAAVGAIRSAAEGAIPYRGWVRKLSGAERYSKEVAASIAAGTIRRAFLKGLGQASGCQASAAPRA